MDVVEECKHSFQRLIRLMERDAEEMTQALQGELLEAYQDLVKREKSMLQKACGYMNNY